MQRARGAPSAQENENADEKIHDAYEAQIILERRSFRAGAATRRRDELGAVTHQVVIQLGPNTPGFAQSLG